MILADSQASGLVMECQLVEAEGLHAERFALGLSDLTSGSYAFRRFRAAKPTMSMPKPIIATEAGSGVTTTAIAEKLRLSTNQDS